MAAPAPTSPARVRPGPPRCSPLDRHPPPAPAQTAAGTAAGHILRRPHTHPFHSSLRSTCSSATETTTNPHFGTYFPVATLTAPHGVTSKSPSKPSALLLAPYRRVGVVARGGASAGLRRPLSAAMLAVTGACMVLAVGSGIVGLVMGLRILCQEGDSRGQTTSGIFFLYGETAAVPQSQGGPGGCRGQGPRGRAFRRGDGSGGRGRRPRGGGVAGRRGVARAMGAAWVRPAGQAHRVRGAQACCC